jgi:hypothetical protein
MAATSCTTSLANQTVTGGLVVPAGATCSLSNVTVTGPVAVSPNATFTTSNNTSIGGGLTATSPAEIGLNGGTINGALSIDGGLGNAVIPVAPEACGVTINGPVTLTDIQSLNAGAYSAFLLGNNDDVAGQDSILPCAGNTIAGSLSITNNTGLVEAGQNHIAGRVTVTGNSGTDDGNVVHLRGNVITGPLMCTGNNPAPTNDGQPNTVQGPRVGQCSSSTF